MMGKVSWQDPEAALASKSGSREMNTRAQLGPQPHPWKTDFSLIFLSYPKHNFSSLHSSNSSRTPRSAPSPFPLQERAGLQERRAIQDKRRSSETRQRPSYGGWTKQPKRKSPESFPRAGKSQRHTTPTVRSSTKTPRLQP